MKGTVVVTGGNGFIGGHVIKQLVTMGYSVISIDPRNEGCLYNKVNEDVLEYWGGYAQILSEANTLQKRGVEHIIHLGAWSNVRESMIQPVRMYENNLMTTAHIVQGILDAGEASKVKSIVFASSSAVEAPESHYGVSKLASEMLLNVFREQMREKVAVATLRFGNVYGPAQNPANGTLIASFVESILTGNRPQIYGDGSQTRDYIYVEDVADGIITAMVQGLSDTMNVCAGISWTVDEVYDYTKQAADSQQLDLEDPEYVDAKPGDKAEVKMEVSDALLGTGWKPDAHVYLGIVQQIRWRENMKGTWKDDHFMDGSLT